MSQNFRIESTARSVPDHVMAEAARRNLGSLVAVRVYPHVLSRIAVPVILVGVITGGIAVYGALGLHKEIAGIGLVPFFLPPLMLLWVFFKVLGAIIYGRRRVYLFDGGLIAQQRRRVESRLWSESSGLEVSEGSNLFGKANDVLRRMGLRTGHLLGDTATCYLNGTREARGAIDVECDGDEPFGPLLIQRAHRAGVTVTRGK
jgi:hypothetical protein